MKRWSRVGVTLITAALAAVTLTVLVPASAGAQYQGGCSITLSAVQTTPGSTVTVTATGLEPGATADFTLSPPPTPIGSAVADADGTAVLTFIVPADLSLGEHTVSTECGGSVQSSVLAVVAAAEVSREPAAGTLPRTGFDPSLLIQAGLLLIAAGGLITLAVRKRSHSEPVG